MTTPGARIRTVARWARRAPGARWATHEFLPRVRRNALLNDVAWRVLAPNHGAWQLSIPLAPGRYLTTSEPDRVPVVALVAVDLAERELTDLTERLAALQREHQSFRPVLIVDQPVFALARRHGFVIEVLTPRRRWTGTDEEWQQYVARILGSVLDHYQPWHLIRLREARLDSVDEALLAHLAERRPGDNDSKQD